MMENKSKTLVVMGVAVAIGAMALTAVAKSVTDVPVPQTYALILIGVCLLMAVIHRLKSL